MNETIKLDLNFLTELGRSKKISLKAPKADLSEEEVSQAMQEIVESQLCLNEGAIDYFEVKGAKYVTTTIEDIFAV